MHFLFLSSIILLLTAFAIGSHVAALTGTSILADIKLHDSHNSASKFGARQDTGIEITPHVQVGPPNDYASLSNTLDGTVNLNNHFGGLSPESIEQAITTALGGFDMATGPTATAIGIEVENDHIITATISLDITERGIFNDWSIFMDNSGEGTPANDAAILLFEQMVNANQIVACFNAWVDNEGWCAIGGVVVDYAGQSETVMDEILVACGGTSSA